MIENTFFSSSHGTITNIGHILAHKIHLNKFKRIAFIDYLLLDHSVIKLEINNKYYWIIPKYLEITQYTSK